jgi:hypothetical protein
MISREDCALVEFKELTAEERERRTERRPR